jgi:hypothetical protein
MGRGLLVVLLAAVVGGALAVSGTARTTGGGTPERATFRLADGSAGCTYDRGELACGSRDTGGAWVDSTTVLRPTESWWHGGFSCRVQSRLLVCTRADGSIATRRNA